MSEKWEETLGSLRSEVLAALSRVDQDAVEVTVGRTAITRDRAAVVLSWNRCVRQHFGPLVKYFAIEVS